MIDTHGNPVLEVVRIFEVAPEAVFDAWLQRDAWQAWIGPEGLLCEVPLQQAFVGGHFQIRMKISEENIIPVIGTYREIEKPARIVFTWGRDGDTKPQSVITVVLKDLGGRTQLTLSHAGLDSAESRDAHGQGWNATFNKLARYLQQ